MTEALVERVRNELAKYEHPLFEFDARASSNGVEVVIQCKSSLVELQSYVLSLQPREIEHSQFPWTFQKQLYDCLHDFVVEMFVRNPQREN